MRYFRMLLSKEMYSMIDIIAIFIVLLVGVKIDNIMFGVVYAVVMVPLSLYVSNILNGVVSNE